LLQRAALRRFETVQGIGTRKVKTFLVPAA
jgi:hypothetical protein